MTTIHHIIKIYRQNKNKGCRILYENYLEKLYTAGLRFIIDKQELEEIIHDVFIKIFQNIERANFSHDAAFYLWSKKILINECLMRLRKNELKFEELDKLQEENMPFEVFHSQLSTEQILKAIHNLPDGYRIVFNLYEVENWTHKEIAELLDITESTSKSQLFKAKKHLQNTLRFYYHESI